MKITELKIIIKTNHIFKRLNSGMEMTEEIIIENEEIYK